MKSSPVSYLRATRLQGNLSSPEDTDGDGSRADTSFLFDHTEPLKALAVVQETLDWPLGELIDCTNTSLFLKSGVVLDLRLGLRVPSSAFALRGKTLKGSHFPVA